VGVWAGIPADRVVAVVAELANGRTQWGSGFLVAGDRVLTAWHCANDKVSGDPPRSLSVIRKVDGGRAPVDHVLSSPGIDVAVLVLRSRSWTEDWDPPKYGRVDRTHAGLLEDCQAIGYPLFQVDARYRQRNTAELHGVIRRTDEAESGFLLMRDLTLETVSVPVDVGHDRRKPDPAWGGLSGALVFHQGYALGIVVEHHPRQGLAAVRILPVDRIAVATEAGGHDVAAALCLPAPADLPMLTGSTVDRDGLQSYLTAAQAATSEHPYALGIEDAPSLGTVYLSQKLGAQVDHAAHPPAMDPNTDVTTDRVRQALQRFDILDVLESNQGALVIGAPGAGKSSLLRHVINALADKGAGAEQYDFIPVLMHARALLGSLPINQAIARAMRENLGAHLDDVDLDDLFADRPAPGVPWLVLLDGLDEIFDVSSRRQVIDIVRRWWGDPRYRFLLASRPLPGRELRVLQTAAIPIFEI
jgi:hypothetical protein